MPLKPFPQACPTRSCSPRKSAPNWLSCPTTNAPVSKTTTRKLHRMWPPLRRLGLGLRIGLCLGLTLTCPLRLRTQFVQFGGHALDILAGFALGHLRWIDSQAGLMGGDVPLLDFTETLNLILQQGINLAAFVRLARRLGNVNDQAIRSAHATPPLQ